MIAGVGVNDADYAIMKKVNGRQVMCDFYRTWRDMLRRCYTLRYPSYEGCTVTPSWHTFSIFREWMICQDWEGNQLDKDLLGDGTLYSPETCCFVPQELNKLLRRRPSGSKYPKGVSPHGNKFRADITMNGRSQYIGLFDSVEEASRAFRCLRRDYIRQSLRKHPNGRVKSAILATLNKES